jgi:hypothetical protein
MSYFSLLLLEFSNQNLQEFDAEYPASSRHRTVQEINQSGAAFYPLQAVAETIKDVRPLY